MAAKKSIKKNYIYNVTYQILLLLIPFITTPYLGRVLGADGVGSVSFAESIVSFFTLFATLGMTTYGQREISYVQDSKEKRTQVFWETKALEVVTSLIALVIYLPFALTRDNSMMYLILAFNILAVIANVTWFFQGMEEFGKIVFRNIVFKVLNIVYIFVFVRTKSDVNAYVFGLAFFLFVGNASLWISLPKFIGKPIFKDIKPFRNLKIILSLFIPTVAIQIYTVLDKTMIGLITGSSFENGYYEQAIKISKMVLTLVTALGAVMIPRIGYHYGRGETEKVNNYMYRGYRFVWLLGVPLCFGLIGVSPNFVPWFYGDGFDKVVPLLGILGFLVISVGINNVTGMQYLIPTKRENIFTKTVIIGAATNFVLNSILIYFFQSIGAAIASVCAETVIALVQLYYVRDELSAKKVFMSGGHYLFAGLIMLTAIELIGHSLVSSVKNTVLLTVCGAGIYVLILTIMRDKFFLQLLSSVFVKMKTLVHIK